MAPVRALAAATALLLLTGCSVAGRAADLPTAAVAVAPCVETTANPAAARPPVLAGTTSLWFGRDDLWVGLADYPPAVEGSALVLKFPWVTLVKNAPTDTLGAPAVSATRNDAPGEAEVVLGGYTRSFGTGDLAFWPSSVRFPDPGCWTVSGRLADTDVEFVVGVTAPR